LAKVGRAQPNYQMRTASGQVYRDIDQSEEFQLIYRVHDLINCALSDVSGISARHDDLPEAPDRELLSLC
jgi:hypothetical protein